MLAPEPRPERVRVERAALAQKPAPSGLLTVYLAEFAAQEWRVPAWDETGHVPYRFFEPYWDASATDRIPFTIRLDAELVGFCFLREPLKPIL